MSRPLYTRITLGHVEQIYDEQGQCLGQAFIPYEEKPIDRRIIRLDGEATDADALEHDELIEHPEDIAALEKQEKFQPYDMIQPKPEAEASAA